jgi:hypothetical protein
VTLLDDIPGATETVIDYAVRVPPFQGSDRTLICPVHDARRDKGPLDVAMVRAIATAVIKTSSGISAAQRSRLIAAMNQRFEAG